MAAGYNTNFHREDSFSSVLHRHALSFQSGAVNSTSEVIPIGYYHGMNVSNGNLMYCDSSNTIGCSSPSTTTAGNSSSSLLLDSVPGLNHDASLAVEWTEEEQFKLEEGLVKYKDEPSMMKYIKIAALLRDKTVRDVALRCRWMTRKRKKQEEYHSGKKFNYRKDKFVESSSKPNLPSTSMPSMNMTPYSHQSNQMDQKQHVNCKVLTSKAKQLLEQNVQTLNLINSNFSLYKLQDNVDLFCRARDNINNINAMINDMRELSGKIGQICKSFHYVLIKISHKSFATYKFGGSYSCGLLRIGWQFYPGTNSYLQVSYYETDCHIRFSIPLVMCCPRSFILL